ncbi:GTPase HflX [Candidatus Gracilibacteria bacterium 28_42_T64]|nr:GTPase HflX [Candidatus Gracilibacteria bacterium 28_42_T64]
MTRVKSERELEDIQRKIEYTDGEMRVFVADILPKDYEIRKNMKDRMLELENLVNTYGGVVIVRHIQNKAVPDYNTFIGEGRLDDIISEMERENANILILGNILKPHQIYKINEKLRPIGAKAWDRVDLILKIFEKNAQSAESKMQIELAAIKHMGPRIFGMGMELSKQGGGVGTRGKGETNTEIMKRHLRKKEQHIRKELDHYSKVRAQHRQSRARKGFLTIGVVGYTNAGKSTLTNALTKKGVLAEDKLFATLGTSVGKMWLPTPDGRGKNFLINDTIGFIRELPPKLVEAFKSTLEDSIESDLLLHVVDTGDIKIEEKIRVVDEILEKIGAHQKKLYIFNKTDGVSEERMKELKEKFVDLNPIFISAVEKTGLDELKTQIVENL